MLLTKLCLKFSALKNHCFWHRLNCLTPMCNYGAEREDNKHYLLHCPKFDSMHVDFLCQLSEILAMDIDGMNSKTLCSLLLYGCSQLDNITNRVILIASISYSKKTVLQQPILLFCSLKPWLSLSGTFIIVV